MNRPIGIFIAGVFLLVSGLLGLLIFSLGLFGTITGPSLHTAMAPSERVVAYVTEGIFAVVSVLSCWGGVGLFRMRGWARYVSIVLAALAVCFCALSAVMMLLLRNMPLHAQNLSSHLVHSIFLLFSIVYFILAAIALFWVVYFNREKVRTAFAVAEARRQGEDAFGGVILPRRQQHQVVDLTRIVLWIVAVLFLSGGASMIVLIFLGAPMFLLGWLATGTAALLLEVLWSCILIYSGLGLIFRWRIGWFFAVGVQLYSILSVILLLLPGYAARLVTVGAVLAARFTPGTHATPAEASLLVSSSAVGGLFALVILILLIRSRKDYLT